MYYRFMSISQSRKEHAEEVDLGRHRTKWWSLTLLNQYPLHPTHSPSNYFSILCTYLQIHLLLSSILFYIILMLYLDLRAYFLSFAFSLSLSWWISHVATSSARHLLLSILFLQYISCLAEGGGVLICQVLDGFIGKKGPEHSLKWWALGRVSGCRNHAKVDIRPVRTFWLVCSC